MMWASPDSGIDGSSSECRPVAGHAAPKLLASAFFRHALPPLPAFSTASLQGFPSFSRYM